MMRATLYLGTRAEGTSGLRLALDPTVLVRRVEELAALLLSSGVEGATIVPSFGLWKADIEPSFRVEILGDYTEDGIRALAGILARHYGQDAVLWILEPVTLHGIDGK